MTLTLDRRIATRQGGRTNATNCVTKTQRFAAGGLGIGIVPIHSTETPSRENDTRARTNMAVPMRQVILLAPIVVGGVCLVAASAVVHVPPYDMRRAQRPLSSDFVEVDRLLARGRTREAYARASQLVRDHPASADAHGIAGDAAGSLAASAGIWRLVPLARESKAHYARALRLDPHNARALEGWAGFLSQAPGVLGGDSDSALRVARSLEAVDSARGTIARLRVLLRRKTARVTMDSLVAAAVARHGADSGIVQGASQYYESTGRWLEAVRHRELAFTADSSPERGYRLGRALMEAGELARAATVLGLVWAKERSEGDHGWVGVDRIGWMLAVTAARSGDGLLAGRWCDSVTATNPRHRSALRMRDSLRAAGVRPD